MKRFDEIRARLIAMMSEPDPPLIDAALEIARFEYPRLEPGATRAVLERFGEQAARRLQKLGDVPPRDKVRALNAVLYEEAGFEGDREHYDDVRNSCLNAVVSRRRGIPITLSLVYMDVATRAGASVQGIGFPGHFLVRWDDEAHGHLVLDPFSGGIELSETDCRRILVNHLGDDAVFSPALLAPAGPGAIVERMLTNLKRLYVRQQAFADARRVTDLLLALDPSASEERRDRGLLSFHLGDVAAALRDLETYLEHQSQYSAAVSQFDTAAPAAVEAGSEEESETARIWEHVKTLRRRIASFN